MRRIQRIQHHQTSTGSSPALRLLRCVAFALLVNGVAMSAQEDEGQPMDTHSTTAHTITRAYTAEYSLTRRGRQHGTAGRSLSALGDNRWRYETYSRASMMLLSDRRVNDTVFQLTDTRVEPLSFAYERRGSGSNRAYQVTFDRNAQTLIPSTPEAVAIPWQDDLLDANAVLHQLQIDLALAQETQFTYALVDDDGTLAHYTFAIEARETIVLGNHQIEAIRVIRVRDHDRRQTRFWFAPAWNYTLVRLQQLEGGREAAVLNLTSLEFFD